MLWIKKDMHYHKRKHKGKERVIENTLLHEHSLFSRGCFRVQRNLFNYLWNLKTLILVANIREDQPISTIWEPQNICLPKCRKRGDELWDSIFFFFFYRGQKTLKNRHGRLGCEFGHILPQKGRKGCSLLSPEGSWAKAQNGAIQHF